MGEIIGVIAVSGVVSVMIIMSLGIVTSILVKSIRGGTRRSRNSDASETKLIQEIYHGLNKMDQRIEALETLLLDKDEERKKREEFDRELYRG